MASERPFCSSCNTVRAKYKCPKTKHRYCSSKCFKKIQKDFEGGKIRAIIEKIPVSKRPGATYDFGKRKKGKIEEEVEMNTWHRYDEEDDRICPEKMDFLDSQGIKDLLANPHLRQMLTFMDTARNKDKCMEKAMQEPLFQEFADACLKLVESDNEEEVSPVSTEDFVDERNFEVLQF